jgi:hypothetical protein
MWTDLVWLLDSILLSVVLVLGVGTAIYTLVQTALARKRLFTLLTIQRHLRHLSTQPESVIKATIRDTTAQLTLKQWLALTKRREQWIPEGLEEYWREALQTSEKVREIVALARHARNKWRRIEALVCLGYSRHRTLWMCCTRGSRRLTRTSPMLPCSPLAKSKIASPPLSCLGF